MSKFKESLKYFTALFQIRNNYLRYLRAIFLYRLKRKVFFPASKLKLKGALFLTRENSMDIPHLSNQYEEETTNLLLKLNPKTFLDVGTHIGRFSIILAKKGSNVISIEPSKENLKQLNKNIKLNNLQEKIKVIPVGCSDKNGKSIFYFMPHNEGLSSLKEKEGSVKETILVRKLDDVCKELKINSEKIKAIKIDVEGFELNVLKGSISILKKGHPLLIIEITDSKEEKSITNFLDKFGFCGKKVLDGRNFIFTKKY